MTLFSSGQSLPRRSISPPESPNPTTPAQLTPNMSSLSQNGQSDELSRPKSPVGIGLTFPTESAGFGSQNSRSTSPSAEHSLIHSAPHYVARPVSPRQVGESAPYASSSMNASSSEGHRERGPSQTKAAIETGFIEGTPPPPDYPSPYTPIDGKKEPPPLYDRDTSWTPPLSYPGQQQTHYPLSGVNDGLPHYGASIPTATLPTPKFTDSTAYWIGLYFFFNLGLTLFNKIVLVSFPFPYTLTGLHALSGCAGCYIALERGAFTPARLTQKENLVLAAFSVLYTINIAVSNISLQLVTVPFHQVVRAATPLFTIFMTAAFLRQRFSVMKLVSLLPVVAGVGFATYGDYYFTAWGLILTLLGTFLAALKTIVTNVMQTGGGGRLKLHPLDLLMRMSPLAFVQCVVYGWYTGELERVRRYGATQMTRSKAFALLINGMIACGLNIVSFTANKKAGALTMTVSANCKQVLTIALAVFLFNYDITFTNGIGIFLTLVGGGWYGYVEYAEKNKKRLGKVLEKA